MQAARRELACNTKLAKTLGRSRAPVSFRAIGRAPQLRMSEARDQVLDRRAPRPGVSGQPQGPIGCKGPPRSQGSCAWQDMTNQASPRSARGWNSERHPRRSTRQAPIAHSRSFRDRVRALLRSALPNIGSCLARPPVHRWRAATSKGAAPASSRNSPTAAPTFAAAATKASPTSAWWCSSDASRPGGRRSGGAERTSGRKGADLSIRSLTHQACAAAFALATSAMTSSATLRGTGS